MFNQQKNNSLVPNRRVWLAALFLTLSSVFPLAAQDQGTQQSPDNGKPKQEVPAEAGGPTDSVGPYAIPKKKAEEAPPPPPVTPKKVEDMPDYSLKVNVPLVNVDVLVTTKNGQFVP
ncbi:MAG TPA: hypothetical protein VM715_06850, partial [Candidatus Acidoferrum sp.]|nr:hypothetical protein [Candidatus Acidoferrum sp.]